MTRKDFEETQELKAPIKNKKQKKNKKLKNYYNENTALAIGVIVINFLFVFIIMNTTRFSALSTKTFVLLNVALLVVLILLDVIAILAIRQKKWWLYVVNLVLVAAMLISGIYATYFLTRVNNSLNNLTDTTTETNVTTSFVIYSKADGTIITEEADLDGLKVGYSTGTSTAELGQKRLASDGVSVTYQEYSGYTDVFTALINGEIQCAILPQSYASIFESDEGLSTYVADTQSILDFTDTYTSEGTSGSNKDMTKEPFTVLITGENEGLADTIILVTVNPVSMKVTMTSIPRDSYVPITCYNNGSDKINAAHAVSEGCMVNTVTQLTGIDIDYTVEFNFASVIQVADAVGGVEVYNTTPFVGQAWNIETDSLENVEMPTDGWVHLDGKQTLAFVRERYAFADGDFARQRHQQEVIEYIVNKVLESGSTEMLLNILEAAGDNITTNITTEQMVNFMSYAMTKVKRYYNPSSPIGVFNIQSSHLAGYASNLWSASLQIDLWIYRLYNGGISDTYTALLRNLNLDSAISASTSVSWSAGDTFSAPAISYEEYNETKILDDGRPVETAEPTETENPEETESPEIDVTPTPSDETDTGGDEGGDTTGGDENTGGDTTGGDSSEGGDTSGGDADPSVDNGE